MAQIISQIPSGTINGTNKIFTTTAGITGVVSIFKDGAECVASDYSFTPGDSEFEFVDAPLISVSIVYINGSGFILNSGEILYTNQSLSGTINGTNKVFTVSGAPIKQVLSIVYDGAETREFSFTPGTNTITFVSAPTVALSPIYLDYIGYGTGSGTESFTNNSSQSDIINRIYNDILHEKTTSTIFNIETAKKYINEVQDGICTGGLFDLTGQIIKAPNLSFLNKTVGFNSFAPTSIIDDISVGATTIKTVNNYPTYGTLFVNGMILPFNGNDGETITLTNPILQPVKKDSAVFIVYSLISSVGKPLAVKGYIGGVERDLDEIDIRRSFSNTNTGEGYFICEDFYDNKYIGLIFRDDATFNVSYKIKSPDITSSVNSVLPKTYGESIISPIVAAKFLFPDEPQKAQNIEMLGLKELRRLYLEFAEKGDTFGRTIGTDNSYHIKF